MTSIYEKKNFGRGTDSHAEQMSLYNFIILRIQQWTQMKTKQLKQDSLNQQESIGFPKLTKFRSSRPEMFCKKEVLENFVKFTGKHLCHSLFFNKAVGTCGT